MTSNRQKAEGLARMKALKVVGSGSEEVAPLVLKTPDAAVYIGRSVAYLKKARLGGTKISGPEFIKIGKRVYYRVAHLRRWLDQFEPMTVLPKDSNPSETANKVVGEPTSKAVGEPESKAAGEPASQAK